MSILLDALKKSEEQRQLGTTPDIHGPGDHKPEYSRFSAPAWLPGVMMAMAVAAIGWLVWEQFREPDIATVSGTPEVSQRAAAVPPEEAVGPGQAEPGQRTPVESFTADGSSTDNAQPPADQAEERRRQLARTFEQYQEPEPETVNANPVESTASPTGTGARPAAPEQAAAAANRPSRRNVLEPHVSEPIPFWELPQNVRDAMPDMHITVMVFAEEPADRFLLVNGVRLKESESLDGVQLEEIRRNGAVFRYRTYRFLIRG